MASILIVEDNPANLKMVVMLLEKAGHAVSSAADGEAGVRLAQTIRPDLVLMDIQMPVMDGLEVTRRLRSNPATAHLKIIALSAGDDGRRAKNPRRRLRWLYCQADSLPRFSRTGGGRAGGVVRQAAEWRIPGPQV